MKYLNKILFVSVFIFAGAIIYSARSPLFKNDLINLIPSVGDRYYTRLQLWYSLAKAGDWNSAAIVEKSLDPVDVAAYKSVHQPEELKKLINNLVLKPNKTVEDWMELARIQSLVGKTGEAAESVARAREMDPIREDISRLYYQTTR